MNYAILCVAEQPLIIDKLKSAGAEVIQSSYGLVCKSDLSLENLKAAIGTVTCQIKEIADISKESPDVQRFLGRD